MSSRFLIPILLLATACAGPGALARTPPAGQHEVIGLGDTVHATLERGPSLWRRGPFRSFRFAGRAGVAYNVTVHSGDFDPFLTVPAGEVHGLPELLSDDDSGDGLDARLLYTPRASGDVVLVVQSVNDSVGDFTVLVEPAPPPKRIAIGASVRDTLRPGASYTFTATRGQRLDIQAVSAHFDTYLSIGIVTNGSFEELANDDDGGDEGLDSRLRFTVPADGEYLLSVTAVDSDDDANTVSLYHLSLAEDSGARIDDSPGSSRVEADADGSSAPWDTVAMPAQALPATGDARSRLDGHPHQYRFTAAAKQSYTIDLASSDFDPLAVVGRQTPAGFVEIGRDDDGGDGTDARLSFVTPAAGEYVIQVRAVGAPRGAYVLRLVERPRLVSRPIGIGATVTGKLTGDSPVADHRGAADEWTLNASAGRRYAITMRADFDTYLVIGRTVGGRFVVVAENDDANVTDAETDSTDSRIVITAREGGEYRIRAHAYEPGTLGNYALRVEDIGAFRVAPESRPVTLGAAVSGTLDADDATLEDGSAYEHRTIALRRGDRVTITLTSSAFDPLLAVGTMANGRFIELSSNDDADADSRDARLTMVAPSTGTYVVRVNTFAPTERGVYRLEVQRAR